MKCQQVRRWLSKYHDGHPSGREANDVATHLRDCAQCCGIRDQIVSLDSEVRETVGPQIELLPNLRRGVMECWLAERGTTAATGRHWHPLLWPHRSARLYLLALSAAAALMMLFNHDRWQQNRPGEEQSQPVVRAVQPKQPLTAPQPIAPSIAVDHRSKGVKGGLARRGTQGYDLPGTSELHRHGDGSPALQHQRPNVDDLVHWNGDPESATREWTALSVDEWDRIEARVRQAIQAQDDFVQIPFPRMATTSDQQVAQAVESYTREAAIVDARLSREVTCAFKATALSDLCGRLRANSGIQLVAGNSVADEKVTLFCQKQPLRDVMRQLSRPFGYTWLRSGKENEYRYELAQDLRSQLLEEELRNRDRNAALLALDEELGRYRQYLDLSPDEALAWARNAAGEEKKRLERYASWAWGPLQIYARLTPAEIAALRAGQRINFSGQPQEGERELPADLEKGVLQSMRDVRLVKTENGFRPAREADALKSVSPAQVPEARGRISIEIDQEDLGRMVYDVSSGMTGIYPGGRGSMHGGYLAVGESPSVRSPENAAANLALARDPALSPRITVAPRPAYRPAPDAQTADGGQPPARGYTGALPAQPMVTTAEVLEAIHQATGLPIVADYYTRLYPASSLSVQDVRVFDALNLLGDTMRLRWRKEAPGPTPTFRGYPALRAPARGAGGWLQFRSTSYFHDRVKEVPNRLLRRWAASRKQHGFLPLDDLCEIASLPSAQLDAEEMAEGARVLYGLMEWALFPRRGGLRPYLKHLAAFTPAQRRQMQTPPGLPFSHMSLAQQQGFLTVALGRDGNGMARLEHLAGATMRVDYAVPGTYEWHPLLDEWRLSPGPTSPFTAEALLPRVRERTREAALLAARRIDPQVTAAQIRPTEPVLTILYLPGSGSPLSAGGIHVARTSEKRTMAVRAP
jgi:hypothetical protein